MSICLHNKKAKSAGQKAKAAAGKKIKSDALPKNRKCAANGLPSDNQMAAKKAKKDRHSPELSDSEDNAEHDSVQHLDDLLKTMSHASSGKKQPDCSSDNSARLTRLEMLMARLETKDLASIKGNLSRVGTGQA